MSHSGGELSGGCERREALPAFIVDIDGYEGPVDVLLDLARDQKVDLKHISIVQLADQYLAFIAKARRDNLEMAAEYLVMAAWLAYLKSRLLLPEPPRPDEPSGEQMAAALAYQLRRLEAMRDAGDRLMSGPRLHHDVFPRGEVERFPEVAVVHVVKPTLHDLLKAYATQVVRFQPRALRIEASDLWSVDRALKHLRQMLDRLSGWTPLSRLLPDKTAEGLRQGSTAARSALAATFAASLELTREGRVRLRQGKMFGPLYLGSSARHDGKEKG